MIRPLEAKDIPRLKELECGFDWEIGEDFISGLAVVDADDRPVVIVGAWHRAEVHMVMDRAWSTPGARMLAFQQIHREMERDLAGRGIGYAVTWIDNARAFTRRLMRLGWLESFRTSFHRRLR